MREMFWGGGEADVVDFVGESEGAEGGASGLGGGDGRGADVVEDLRLDEGAGVMVPGGHGWS